MGKIFPKLTALLIAGSLAQPLWADNQAQQLFSDMVAANQKQNYEIIFISLNPLDTSSLRYRQVFKDDKRYAQLLNLDNSPKEVVQRGNIVSYFGNNYPPFSLESDYIVDQLPNVLRARATDLAANYDFIDLGRNRIANRVVQTVRIKPKDDFRYQYVIFVDEENHLLLQSDMLDRDGNLLEQFRVLHLEMKPNTEQLSDYLEFAHLPPLMAVSSESADDKIDWKPGWLPQGFRLIRSQQEKIGENQQLISQLYSDGLFSFRLYVSDAPIAEAPETVWRQGSHTIYSESVHEREVTLIGQVPLSTAKRIVQDVQFK